MTEREMRRKEMLLLTTRYINAMCAKTPESLPVTGNLRVTYNAEVGELGKNELWTYAQASPTAKPLPTLTAARWCCLPL